MSIIFPRCNSMSRVSSVYPVIPIRKSSLKMIDYYNYKTFDFLQQVTDWTNDIFIQRFLRFQCTIEMVFYVHTLCPIVLNTEKDCECFIYNIITLN
jgi:hypothetical protein